MGAKVANPDKLVVNVMGDGAVGMTGMDWETASRNDIPILSVIKHDSIFSGLRQAHPRGGRALQGLDHDRLLRGGRGGARLLRRVVTNTSGGGV